MRASRVAGRALAGRDDGRAPRPRTLLADARVADLLAALGAPRGLRTARTAAYLRWRYGLRGARLPGDRARRRPGARASRCSGCAAAAERSRPACPTCSCRTAPPARRAQPAARGRPQDRRRLRDPGAAARATGSRCPTRATSRSPARARCSRGDRSADSSAPPALARSRLLARRRGAPVNAGEQPRATAMSVLRRIARRPRPLARRRARPTGSTDAVARGGRDAFERARSRAGPAAGAPRAPPTGTASSRPRPCPRRRDPRHRSVSIVLIATDAADRHGHDRRDRPPARPDVDVVVARPEPGERRGRRRGRRRRGTRGELLCFLLASSAALEPGWLARLAAAVDGTTVGRRAAGRAPVAAPRSRHTARRSRARPRARPSPCVDDAPALRAARRGTAVRAVTDSGPTPPSPVDGATAACLLVDRAAYEAAGALPDFRRHRPRDVRALPRACAPRRRDRRRWSRRGHRRSSPRARPLARSSTPISAHEPGVALATSRRTGRSSCRGAHPLPPDDCASRSRSPRLRRRSRRVGATGTSREAFARALRRRGHVVRVQTLDHADDLAGRACDVHCVVRGLEPGAPHPGPGPRALGDQPSRAGRARRSATPPISCWSRRCASPTSCGRARARRSR